MNQTSCAKEKGFTLIELMVAVAIVGILGAVVYPSYRAHVAKANRSSAQQLMLSIAQKEQQYFLDARGYASGMDSTGLNIAAPQGWTCGASACSNANFTVTASVSGGMTSSGSTPPSFTISAAASSAGTNKNETTLTLTNTGAKTGVWN